MGKLRVNKEWFRNAGAVQKAQVSKLELSTMKIARVDEFPDLMTIAEFADKIRCGLTKAKTLVRTKQVYSIKSGHQRLIPVTELPRYFSQQE